MTEKERTMNYEVEYYKECAAHAETKLKFAKEIESRKTFAATALVTVDELVSILGEAGVLNRSDLASVKASLRDALRG
jgi:hypothetical protein